MRTPKILQTILFENFKSSPKIEINSNDILVLKTSYSEELEYKIWDEIIKLLTEEMVDEINRFVRWQDRHNSLFGKLLMYLGYYYLTDTEINLNHYKKNKNGKPYLNNSNLKFNISHTNKTVVCVFNNEEVGVDIEEVNTVDYNDFKNVFAKEEIITLEQNDDYIKFYELWTKKEAVAKVLGQGLYIPLQNINAVKDEIKYNGEIFDIKKFTVERNLCSIAYRRNTTKKIKWINVDI